MKKEDYIEVVNKKIKNKNARKIMLEQIERYYEIVDTYSQPKKDYKVGDSVILKKGTLMHGTYKNMDGLKKILKEGLISSWFIDGRASKYPSSVGLWNLKQDYDLKEYINFYSGGTIMYYGLYEDGVSTQENKSEVIPYHEMSNLMDYPKRNKCRMWTLEQTKEARFLPSLVQDNVQIGIIFNGESKGIKTLLKSDILTQFINDEDVREFVNENYYDAFIIERKNKNDFFTDRESAILFGIPVCFIEGILVGRTYEQDKNRLKEIKDLLPNSYICNLDGKVIG